MCTAHMGSRTKVETAHSWVGSVVLPWVQYSQKEPTQPTTTGLSFPPVCSDLVCRAQADEAGKTPHVVVGTQGYVPQSHGLPHVLHTQTVLPGPSTPHGSTCCHLERDMEASGQTKSSSEVPAGHQWFWPQALSSMDSASFPHSRERQCLQTLFFLLRDMAFYELIFPLKMKSLPGEGFPRAAVTIPSMPPRTHRC